MGASALRRAPIFLLGRLVASLHCSMPRVAQAIERSYNAKKAPKDGAYT